MSMTIERVLVGTWFPRTTLHLDEVDAALRGEKLPHHPKELPRFLRALRVSQVEKTNGAFRFLTARAGNVSLSLTEDGILLLGTTGDRLAEARARLTVFYEDKFSPVVEALFRRGMPLPKELADIRAVLPFFVVATGGSAAEARALARRQGAVPTGVIMRGGLTIFPSRDVTVLWLADRAAVRALALSLEDIVRYATFFREFEAQLHTYLRLHRDLWESVDAIHEARHLRYRDLARLRDRLGSQRKTIGFVRGRIAQMGDILSARSRHIHDEHREPVLDALELNRFDSLEGAQAYLAHLWEVTDRYAEATADLLRLVYDENLRREVAILNMIFFGALITGFFGMNVPLPWEARWDTQWPSTVLVAFFLVLLGVGGYLLLHHLVLNRRFVLREIEGRKKGTPR